MNELNQLFRYRNRSCHIWQLCNKKLHAPWLPHRSGTGCYNPSSFPPPDRKQQRGRSCLWRPWIQQSRESGEIQNDGHLSKIKFRTNRLPASIKVSDFYKGINRNKPGHMYQGGAQQRFLQGISVFI